ncbi:hypothetical protein GCM10011331_16020 [Flavimobilis marinus]|uniref:Uncharacterized protein n=1 Tax=Flavimobilis marinus TaxID=285351 RepID=A0A1I2FK48_9MICO|nr:hypothetical protein [Flavimobilis marinus]GHG51891.1 hypothetical protein GCM10011331_16020 [Flavimobilis marinus]SFF05393.1 hypothetical protein SAMN04488035_1356 [Flavimobilis marinus]
MHALRPGARRLAAFLAPLLVLVGFIGAVVGVVASVSAAKERDGAISVPVHLNASDGLGAELELTVGDGHGSPYPGVTVSGIRTGGLPHRDHRTSPLGVVTLHTTGASDLEQVMSRGDVLLRGLSLFVAALALLPVLRALVDQRSFRVAHAHRLWIVAACVITGGYVAPLLPWWASASVLGKLHDAYGMSARPIHHLQVWVIAALVVVVGEVVRASVSPADVRPEDLGDSGSGHAIP